MKRVSLLARLNAVGSLVDGLIAEIEEEDLEAAGSGECAHPIDQQIDESTMDDRPGGWRCRACGFSTVPMNDTSADAPAHTPLEEESNVSNSR